MHSDGFHFLATVNKVVISMAEPVSLENDAESFGHILRSGTAGPHGRLLFSFLRAFTKTSRVSGPGFSPTDNE